MGLKNAKGNYLKAAVLESVNFTQGKAYVRIYQYDSEEQRQDDFAHPEKNFCVQEVDITSEQIDMFQKEAYSMVKNHKVKTGENKIDPVTEWVEPVLDEDDNVVEEGYDEIIEEGYSEDIFEQPYKDMTDC